MFKHLKHGALPARVVDAVGVELVDVADHLPALLEHGTVLDDLARRLGPLLQTRDVLPTNSPRVTTGIAVNPK